MESLKTTQKYVTHTNADHELIYSDCLNGYIYYIFVIVNFSQEMINLITEKYEHEIMFIK